MSYGQHITGTEYHTGEVILGSDKIRPVSGNAPFGFRGMTGLGDCLKEIKTPELRQKE